MNLRWHNPLNGRRYQAVLGPDLFGDWVLWRGWCGADGRRGGERRDVFTWEDHCLSALRRVIRRRQRRGYVLLYGGLPSGCVQGQGPATQEAPKTHAGMDRAAKPLVQVAPGDALGERS